MYIVVNLDIPRLWHALNIDLIKVSQCACKPVKLLHVDSVVYFAIIDYSITLWGCAEYYAFYNSIHGNQVV